MIYGDNNMWTFTKADGTFILYYNGPISNLRISGAKTSKTTVWGVVNNGIYNSVLLNQFQPIQDLTLNNLTISSTYNAVAQNSIDVSNTLVNTSGNATLQCPAIIRLNPGFHADMGSYFHTIMEPIYINCAIVETTYQISEANPTEITHILVEGNDGETLAIHELNQTDKLLVYPNPTSGMFKVSFENSDRKYKIYISNGIGQIVYEGFLFERQTMIDLSDQQKGVFMISIVDELMNSYNSKIVIY